MRGILRQGALLAAMLAAFPAGAEEPDPGRLTLHQVPVDLHSHRLLSMSMDNDGGVWAGSIHRQIHRYDPRSGKLQTIPLPCDSSAASCLCSGDKVYILGQSYPRLIVYDRRRDHFEEYEYPGPRPDVWYGSVRPGGESIDLFDRGSSGVIRWDTATDTGRVISWPYEAPLPTGGRFVPEDRALWCYVWRVVGFQYLPIGLARLDADSDKFTSWHPFPAEGEELEADSDPDHTLYLPRTLQGQLVPFDWKALAWRRAIPVPRYGELFGFLGGPVTHRGRSYYSLSTYNGTEVGCDGQPYHFCNAVLEFDPRARRFHFYELSGDDAYYQLAYSLSAGGEFFVTGTNIREPDGRLNRDRAGEVIFWQTLPAGGAR